MAEAKNTKEVPVKKKGGKATAFLIVLTVIVAAPFMMPSILLLLVGLCPTYVSFATDDDPRKSGAISVGMMNIAGIVPFIIDLWKKGQTIPNAMTILTSSNSWLVILGAAAVGHLIVYAIPQAIATLTLAQAETRAKALHKNLEMLKQSWGPEVATTKPIEKMIQD